MSDPFTNLIDKMDDPQIAIITLSKNTHHSSIIFFIAFLFMLIFVLGPVTFNYKTMYGIKFCIILLLGLALYNNYIGADFIKNTYSDELKNDKSWQPVRTHITYTYIYMLFILILMICFILF